MLGSQQQAPTPDVSAWLTWIFSIKAAARTV